MQLIEGKCQSCLCFAFFTSIAAATMVALAIFWTLSSAIFEGGFPTVISLRGRQHFWICSFLVSTVWRSQHNLSEYLVDGISSALKKLSLYFKQRCVLWILGLPGKKVNFRLSLSKLQKSRCLPQNGAVQPACLTASLIFFFFWLLFFCLVLFLLFFIGQKCAALLFRTKIVSIGYFDNEGKTWDPRSTYQQTAIVWHRKKSG